MNVQASSVCKALSRADEECARAGQRLTVKRKNVLTELLVSPTPLSAYDIVAALEKSHGQAVTPMSVYRMLDFLVDNNLAHRLRTENKYLACSHITCSHAHSVPQFLICNRCQKVKEIAIDSRVLESLGRSVAKAGYQLTQSQLELRCLCDECSAKSHAG